MADIEDPDIDTTLERLEIAWRAFDDDGMYVKANSVSEGIRLINALRERAEKAEGIVDGARRYAEAHTLLYQQAMARAENAEAALRFYSDPMNCRRGVFGTLSRNGNRDEWERDEGKVARAALEEVEADRDAWKARTALAKPQEPTS